MRKVKITEHFPISDRPYFKLADAETDKILAIRTYKASDDLLKSEQLGILSRDHNLKEIKELAKLYETSVLDETIELIYVTKNN